MTTPSTNYDEDQIQAAKTGVVWVSPKGTTAPTDATSTMPSGWFSVGLVTDDGIVTTYEKDSEEKMAFNVRGVVKRIPKSAKYTVKYTAMQTTAKNHQLYFGSAPVAIAGSTGQTRTNINASSDVTEWQYCVEILTTDGDHERTVVPRAVVTDLGDITYSETDLKQFEMTLAAQISPGVDYLAYILSDADGLVTV